MQDDVARNDYEQYLKNQAAYTPVEAVQMASTEELLERVEQQRIEQQVKAAIKSFDAVNHPKHYTSHPARCSCGASIECIQITEHYSFNLGNALKYLWRADLKGAAIQDLEKAVWYINREIAKRKKEQP